MKLLLVKMASASAAAMSAVAKSQRRHAAKRGHQVTMGRLESFYRKRVAPLVRSTHLAHGFLSGRSYSQMERASYSTPNWDEIEVLALRYSIGYDPRIIKQAFACWVDEAKQYHTTGQLDYF